MKKVTRIDWSENTPIDGEAYAIFTDGTRYAFAWGATHPYADSVPAQDVLDGASGLSWHDSEEAARQAMQAALDA